MWCPLSVCLIYLHCLCPCRIPQRCLFGPDTSGGWEAFLAPVSFPLISSKDIRPVTARAPTSGSTQTSSDVDGTWLGFLGSVLTCQRDPPNVLRVAEQIREGAEML